jgi:hypothetical protein
MLLLCDNVTRKVPIVYFFSLSLRNLHSWSPKVECLLQNMLSCGVFHHGSSTCVVALTFLHFTPFYSVTTEHNAGDGRQCNIVDVR